MTSSEPVESESGFTTDECPVCPKCNIQMVERTANRGANAGSTFFGCPNYPKCRETARPLTH